MDDGKDQNIKKDGEDPSVSIVTKVAPPAASEQNDRRAVRSRSRRERPRKLRPLPSDHNDAVDRHPRFDAIEPDVESFVASCLGVTLTHGTTSQISKLARKRSLPSLSFLSQKTFAEAEKKRRKEEQARQKLLAEEAAKKIMDSTMQALNGTGVDGTFNTTEAPSRVNNEANISTVTTRESASRSHNPDNIVSKTNTTTTTTTFEGQSNILMPPLLVEFLNSLREHKDRYVNHKSDDDK
jgi:hypothetical protein